MENITLGNLTLITGSNGSGKTKLIQSLKPDEGYKLRYLVYGDRVDADLPYRGLKEWVSCIFPHYDGRIKSRHQGKAIRHGVVMIHTLKHSKPGDTVILENPEAYLHPSSQVKLMELCINVARLGLKVVIETVSDHILYALRIAIKDKLIEGSLVKVYHLSRVGDETSIHPVLIDSNGRMDKVSKKFFMDYEKHLDNLMS